MSGKNLHLTPLESRRQLLLVESELNRARLLNELADLKNEAGHLKGRINAIGSLAAAAARLVDTFFAIRNAFTHQETGANKKSSWISTLFNGVRTGALILIALRSHQK